MAYNLFIYTFTSYRVEQKTGPLLKVVARVYDDTERR